MKRRFAPRDQWPLRGRGCGFAAGQGEGEARLRRGGMRVGVGDGVGLELDGEMEGATEALFDDFGEGGEASFLDVVFDF